MSTDPDSTVVAEVLSSDSTVKAGLEEEGARMDDGCSDGGGWKEGLD